MPENVVSMLLLPKLTPRRPMRNWTRRACRGVSPPSVAEVSDPKLKAPLPLVSSVLFCKANGLPSVSVPPLISVLPLKVFVAARISVPLSTFVRLPGPERAPEKVTVAPAVSKVAAPPLPSVMGMLARLSISTDEL